MIQEIKELLDKWQAACTALPAEFYVADGLTKTINPNASIFQSYVQMERLFERNPLAYLVVAAANAMLVPLFELHTKLMRDQLMAANVQKKLDELTMLHPEDDGVIFLEKCWERLFPEKTDEPKNDYAS